MSNPILIIAHPGHELRLFRWMEIYRPTIFVLTDGAGSNSASRIHYTQTTLEITGAKAGDIFGQMTDRDWYTAILRRDPNLLINTAKRIFKEVSNEAPTLIVTDPIEGYNPMHDLCAGIAVAVQALFKARGIQIELGTYDLTRALPDTGCIERIYLDEAARRRKEQAIAAYEPLSGEASSIMAHSPDALNEEAILLMAPVTEILDSLTMPPEYEKVGKERVRDGRYKNAIGYAEHIKPAFDDLISFSRASA